MPTRILLWADAASMVLICIAFVLTVYRIVRGPTLPDRVLGLDVLVSIAIGFMALFAIKTGYALYIDIAIALGLVGFLATVAFARFILVKGAQASAVQDVVEEGDTPLGMTPRTAGGRHE
ncbi:cation:proton antiporter [Pararhizobium mangrovi]|uniref:Cation:proton antiporter n=1 Tax=Pararhizobium mangrovi TaxID=2590452 RepID=A0A506U1B4_9HYPH|nr:cation:proton antiporter [Pararhizobium mangrovi]TPW26725.1 hypothetical protein FJU11_13840 [Pararhizobium mangrovi]